MNPAEVFFPRVCWKKRANLARKNVRLFKDVITADTPLVGVEPSAILTFRDEYPDLLRGEEKENAKRIASPYVYDRRVSGERTGSGKY